MGLVGGIFNLGMVRIGFLGVFLVLLLSCVRFL